MSLNLTHLNCWLNSQVKIVIKEIMKTYSSALFIFLSILLALFQDSCSSAQNQDYQAQQPKLRSIINNQPAPDLNGYSFERDILIQVYQARNRNVTTFTYMYSETTGQIIKICDSIGMPIPYSTQLTPPYVPTANGGSVPNPEPNSLYSPDSAEGSIIVCLNDDNTLSPTYFEPRVFALPFEIKADKVFERISGSSLNIEQKK